MDPLKDHWSLMGGFLQASESLDEAAKRITYSLTGLNDVYLDQLYTFGDINRDPGGRIVSVTYFALIKINDSDCQVLEKNGAHWVSANAIPSLIFDHNSMVDTALNKLRKRCRTQPVGFELLPDKFTIPQLQLLYEAILMQPLDKRNFRKKILRMNLLDKLDEKDRNGSKKGAYYYRFNTEKYNNFTQQGFNFEV